MAGLRDLGDDRLLISRHCGRRDMVDCAEARRLTGDDREAVALLYLGKCLNTLPECVST